MNSPNASRQRASGAYRVDVGYLLVFLIVLAVLGGVAYHIYNSTRVSVDEIEWPDPLSMGRSKTQQRLAQTVGNVQGPLLIPTATAATTAAAPPVGQSAAPVQSQPVATRVAPSSIPLAALERAITSPNDAAPVTRAPSPPPAVGATPVAAATSQGRMKIANTGGDGVFVRRTPKMNDRIIAWPDNTPIEFLGETAEGDGQTWSKVRDPRGNVGWVPSQYLAPDAGAPAAAAPAPPAPAIAGSVRTAAPAAPAPVPPPQPVRNP
jgi:hypothetical protein